jgi:hypothetical protein
MIHNSRLDSAENATFDHGLAQLGPNGRLSNVLFGDATAYQVKLQRQGCMIQAKFWYFPLSSAFSVALMS